jgi:uncharacterized protein YjbI with pentapeptide repeats
MERFSGRTFFSAIILVVMPLTAQVPVAGPNVNMVSGTGWPGGDPFLQRQNEPSMAVSSRNPSHLLAGANDYRTVDLSVVLSASGDPDANTTGDAWLGVFKSFDGGQTWRSTLLPGCRYAVTDCQGSPISSQNYQAGADPVVRAGSNGMFYYSGIAFDRDHGRSVFFVSRFIDDNNRERSVDDTIRYLGAAIVDQEGSGQFVDKPWIAVDVPRASAATCSVPASGNGPAQSFPGGIVYAAFSRFTGTNNSSQIYVSRSADCGVTWSNPSKVSAGTAKTQGATLAIDPASGAIYVAWRQFQLDTTQPDAILISKSTDGGKTFAKPATVSNIIPFDLGESAYGFRTLSFPSIAVDPTGRVYVVWAARQTANGDSRIMLSVSAGGTAWPAAQIVETPPALYDSSTNPATLVQPGLGHQLMPAINIANGKVAIVYYSLYEDSTAGQFLCPVGSFCNSIAQLFEYRRPVGPLLPAPPSSSQLSTVFTQGIFDLTPAGSPPLTRRHTMDVRAALAAIGPAPSFTASRISQYMFGSPSNSPGTSKIIQQLRFNVPNLPLFAQGTEPFMGDYLDLAPPVIVPGATPGAWSYNTSGSIKPEFHAIWTDNRDVRPPADGDWTHYTPIPLAGYNVGPQFPACQPGQAGMRNQNIYTARITEGLSVSAPGNSKQLSTSLQRAFSVVVQNNTDQARSYRLTIANQPAGGTASFLQAGFLTTLDATAARRSSISRTVFATSSQARAQITVNVVEISAPGGNIVQNGQQSSVLLNPDLTNPDLTNPDLTNPSIQVAELYVPDLTNPDLTNPDLTNPDLTNPDLTNHDVTNPDLTNPDLTNPDLTNIGIANPDLTNPDLTNPDLTNPDLTNTDIRNGSLTDVSWTLKNQGNTTASFTIHLVTPLGQQSVPPGFKTQLLLTKTYITPTISNTTCQLIQVGQAVLVTNIPNPVFFSPASLDLTNPNLTDASVTNPTVTLAPGESARVTLRIEAPTKAQAVQFATTVVQPVAVAQAVNTNAAAGSSPAAALAITTLAAPNAQLGQAYNLQLQAVGGSGSRTWSLASGALPSGLSLSSSGVISGIPSATGSSSFTVQVIDSGTPQQSDTRPLSITVTSQAPFAAVQILPPGGTVGQPYSYTPAATGGNPPYTWLFFGLMPPGMSIAPVTGVISGTPTSPGQFGGYYIAQDSSVPAQFALLPAPITVSTSTLAFVTQPVNGTQGHNLPVVTVRALDATSSPVSGLNVNVFLDPNPSGGTLTGTTTVMTDAAGIATFSNLQVSRGGWNYRLRASASSVGPASSKPFHVAGFAPGASLVAARRQNSVTALADGSVLVAGGYNASTQALTSAEIYRATATGSSSTLTGSMASPRGFHTATRLADGRVLIAGGEQPGVALAISSAEIYNPATGNFSPAANSMSSAHSRHTATLLPDGRVLIAGGINNSGLAVATADLFDPATNSFSGPVPMVSARTNHTATLLLNGAVLITGGTVPSTTTVWNTAEIFDPATGSFMAVAATMQMPRWYHQATRLADGTVLLAGGYHTSTNISGEDAEIYNPLTGTFTATGNVTSSLPGAGATLLGSGKVLTVYSPSTSSNGNLYTPNPNPALGATNPADSVSAPNKHFDCAMAATPDGLVVVAGGDSSNPTVDIYYPTDPPFQTTGFILTGNMGTSRSGFIATRLATWKVLVAGGLNGSALVNSAELYDPAAGTFAPTGNMVTARTAHTATLLHNGKVLITGGSDSSLNAIATAELYDPAAGTFTSTGSMNTGRFNHTATLLPDGRVLITGGYLGPALAADSTAEIYDPAGGVFTSLGDHMTVARAEHAATLLKNGKVLLVGGIGSPNFNSSADLYDPATGTFIATGSMGTARRRATATLLDNGNVLVAGGNNTGGSINTAEIYSPGTGSFIPTGTMTVARDFHAATLLTNGKVLITGGLNSGVTTPTSELFDPLAGTFFSTANMNTGRQNHTMTVLTNGKVLVTGGATILSGELFLP